MTKQRLKKAALAVSVLALTVVLTYNLWPTPVKEKTSAIPHDVRTFERRTTFFWEPAAEAALKRPFLGWGYGDGIYRDPRPFESGPLPTWELKGGLHSAYVTTLFHQGIVDLAAHLFRSFHSRHNSPRPINAAATGRRPRESHATASACS